MSAVMTPQTADLSFKAIATAMRKTREFVRDNQAVVTAILNGLNYQRIAEDAARASEEPQP